MQLQLVPAPRLYNVHRWYSPATGSYTRPDPLGIFDGPNPYLDSLLFDCIEELGLNSPGAPGGRLGQPFDRCEAAPPPETPESAQ